MNEVLSGTRSVQERILEDGEVVTDLHGPQQPIPVNSPASLTWLRKLATSMYSTADIGVEYSFQYSTTMMISSGFNIAKKILGKSASCGTPFRHARRYSM